jgi:hypothetical protein
MDSNFSSIEAANIPSELAGPLPRRLRLSGNGIQMVVLAAIFLVLAIVAALWSGIGTVQELRYREALRRDGKDTVGEITRLWSSGRSLKLRVSYTFSVDEIHFAGNAQVPEQIGGSLRGASSLPIRYLPANPAINHPATWEWSALQQAGRIQASILLATIALILFVPLRFERTLIARGSPIVGVITKCSPGRRGGFSVNYDFRTQDGRVTKGSGWSPSRSEIGASVWILHVPQNPRRNQPYPSLNYRVTQ